MNDGLGNTYAWDAENRMTTTASVNYTYDGDGKRLKKSNGTLYWYSMGGDVLAETDLSGNNLREFVYFGGARIARRDNSGAVYYFFGDHLGTAKVMTNSTGATQQESTYYPFGGEQRVITNTVDNRYKFTGLERDAESGLDHTLFRMYPSNLARWHSPDPLAGDIMYPQSLNRYSYVMNNPVNFTDPMGLSAEDACLTYPGFNYGNCNIWPSGGGGGWGGGSSDLDPGLCIDSPFPDPTCGLPPGVTIGGWGGGGGGNGGGGGRDANGGANTAGAGGAGGVSPGVGNAFLGFDILCSQVRVGGAPPDPAKCYLYFFGHNLGNFRTIASLFATGVSGAAVVAGAIPPPDAVPSPIATTSCNAYSLANRPDLTLACEFFDNTPSNNFIRGCLQANFINFHGITGYYDESPILSSTILMPFGATLFPMYGAASHLYCITRGKIFGE